MERVLLVVAAVLACCQMRSFAQGIPATPIALTDKITNLEGVWIRDPTKGVRDSCANTVDQIDQSARAVIRIRVSPQGVNIESERLKQLFPLDGSPVKVSDSAVATATLDAGWLAITIRGIAPGGRGATNVFREVYVAERRQIPFERVVSYDELTIWRNYTIEWPDGSVSSTVCSYRAALVYQRQRQQ